MKVHTSQFKDAIKNMGREIDSKITYGNITLHDELFSVTPLFEGNILKSIMKQLDIESSVDIPINTIINYKLGVKVGNSYEYLDFGNYVVIKSEIQEDTKKYKITCYDKMIYSMKQNEDLGITYPITIKNYLIALATKIGLQVEDTVFANQSKEIPDELYLGQEYTYRDILDEIAQATGSNIIINSNDKIEVKYINNTQEVIDEEFLKDVNVTFKDKFGPVNTIVLSRSGEADNIYYPSPLPENPIQIKIVDNQIMNRNDRDEYLPELYSKLNGLEFYINDFSSTGICYFDVCDLYNISVGENTYKCLMLNDEINVTTGLEELIHTELPEQSETDYEKADKTDRKINQTYLIVDKQNQKIEAVITTVGEQDTKISTLTQTVDELSSKISDVSDVTTHGESEYAIVSLEDINASEPIMLKVHPIITNISYLYPSLTTYPSSDTYLKIRTLRFTRTYEEEGVTKTENIDYQLPDDLLYYDENTYDEFYLDYESQTCQITKRCGYNQDGSVYALENETVVTYDYPTISLGDGDYTIRLLGYSNAYLFVRLMASNIYTTQFATKVELNSAIVQTTESINLSVDERLQYYSTTTEMNTAISLSSNNILSTVSSTYSTKNETNTAKQEAINSANDTTDNKLLQYSTTTEMNTAINQKANEITQSVSETYTVKADTVKEVKVEYALSTSSSTAPSSGWSTTAPQWQQGKYMWQRTTLIYANNTTEVSSTTCIQGAKGETGQNGTNGVGISSIVEYYAVSNSNITEPTNWYTTPQTMTTTNKYLWNYELITYTDSTTYSSPASVIGVYGDKGQNGTNGADGVGVSAIEEQYYLSTSSSSPTGGSWSNTQPTWVSGKYIWIRDKITWTNSTTTYTTPVLASGLNEANETANDVKVNFGTYITQNAQSVKVAWNQITENIQLETLNNIANLTIRDDNENLLMSLNKTGQHFYESNTIFGELGVQTVTEDNIDKNYIAFSVKGAYNSTINDGMAWGITTSNDDIFHPIFYIKNFEMGTQQSDAHYGQLVLSSCDLVLEGTDTGIQTGNILMHGNALNGISFEDINGNVLMEIYPEQSPIVDRSVNLLGGAIQFFTNLTGTSTFKVGGTIITDDTDGFLGIGDSTNKNGLFFCYGYSNFYRNVSVDGNVYANNISSDRRIKENIKDSTKNALDIIKQIQHKQFDKIDDKKHYDIGYIAQDMEKIDANFVLKREATKEFEERYYINELPIIATLSKAIQEQQEEIEELKEKIKKLEV